MSDYKKALELAQKNLSHSYDHNGIIICQALLAAEEMLERARVVIETHHQMPNYSEWLCDRKEMTE